MILNFLVNLLGILVFVGLVHELGHYCMARYYGQRLHFEFSLGCMFGVIPVPRFIWHMPTSLTSSQKENVALAGFTLEFVSVLIIWLIVGDLMFTVVAAIHLILYPLYAGSNSDFKWIQSRK